jgi:hypothetical protein
MKKMTKSKIKLPMGTVLILAALLLIGVPITICLIGKCPTTAEMFCTMGAAALISLLFS